MKLKLVTISTGQPSIYGGRHATLDGDTWHVNFAGTKFLLPSEIIETAGFTKPSVATFGLKRDSLGYAFVRPSKTVSDETLVVIEGYGSDSDKLNQFKMSFMVPGNSEVVACNDVAVAVILKAGDVVSGTRSWLVCKGTKEEPLWVPRSEKVTFRFDGTKIHAVIGIGFDDVIGQDEAKKSVESIVRYLRNPARLQKLGAKVPTGLLLTGDPGNGKTLLARAIAGEAGVPFFAMNGSEFIEGTFGGGVKKIQALFDQARAADKPAIIFIDEIDCIGGARPNDKTSEYVQTLNALLAEMNGFVESVHPIIVIAATNRPRALDPALLRAGRFDRKVNLNNPKAADMIKLFQHYAAKLTIGTSVDLQECARKSAGLPAASVTNICNEAALILFDVDPTGDLNYPVSQWMFEKAIAQEIRAQVGSSKAKRFNVSAESIKLKDVIGQASAKEDVQDIVNYLKNPKVYHDAGARVPRGTLLVGGPGEGKTLMARALAGEAEVPFFSISGSDFVEKWVGTGAARIREVFDEARRSAPCILFIDEFDALARKRASRGSDGGNEEREVTLNQLLVELDGFNQSPEPVILIAATNRKEMLDPAVLRPGRLDREAVFYPPVPADRVALFQHYMRNKALAPEVSLELFASSTSGFSAASIENVCNEAVLQMVRNGEQLVTNACINAAIIRVTVGSPRKNRVRSEKEKKNLAVHEAWHAIAWHVETEGEPIARVTIEGAGSSGGHVQIIDDDRFFHSDVYLRARIVMALAARAAQRIVLQIIDSGASADLRTARSIAHQMVTVYGMSELGDVSEIDGVPHSPAMLEKIEKAVQKILSDCEIRAAQIIEQYGARGARIVDALMAKETMLGDEFVALWQASESLAEEAASESLPLTPVADLKAASSGEPVARRPVVGDSASGEVPDAPSSSGSQS